MRVLVVAYYFPPAGGGGVQRVLSWCRHLPEHGHEVLVVAPEEPHWVDHDTTLVVPRGVRVVRTPDPSPPAVIPREELARVRGARRLARRLALQPRRLALPDVHRRWRRPAREAALAAAAEAGGVDAILTTSPPETVHLVGADLARALDAPWIADYRDSWLDLPHTRVGSPLVRAKHRLQVRMATRTMAHAAAATTVSEPLARDLRARHPELEVHVLENGVEPDEVARAAGRAEGFVDRGRCTILYTGNFFGRQRPTAFLEALERVLERREDARGTLVARFVGGMKPEDEGRIAGSPLLAEAVERERFLRHDDVLASQHAADCLLLYVAPGRGSEGVYTGKVFEYVASRRPVLALAPADNVAARLVADAGGDVVDPEDVAAIATAIEARLDAWCAADGPAGGREPDLDVPDEILARIDRSRTAARMSALLEDAVAARTR